MSLYQCYEVLTQAIVEMD